MILRESPAVEYAARRWVRTMMSRARQKPLDPEAVWATMAEEIGHGPLAIGRTRNLIEVMDRELALHRSGPLRSLRQAAAEYLAREQARLTSH